MWRTGAWTRWCCVPNVWIRGTHNTFINMCRLKLFRLFRQKLFIPIVYFPFELDNIIMHLLNGPYTIRTLYIIIIDFFFLTELLYVNNNNGIEKEKNCSIPNFLWISRNLLNTYTWNNIGYNKGKLMATVNVKNVNARIFSISTSKTYSNQICLTAKYPLDVLLYAIH